MTTATQALFAPPDDTRATTGPTPARRPGPVFIHDAVTPFAGATLLLALWRADHVHRQHED